MPKALTENDLYMLRYKALYGHPRLKVLSAKDRKQLAKGLASQFAYGRSRQNAEFLCYVDPKLRELAIAFAYEREKEKVERTKRGWFGREVKWMADILHCYLLVGGTKKHVYSVAL